MTKRPTDQQLDLPEKVRREVLCVVEVEKERIATDPDLREFVHCSDQHQLSTARRLHHARGVVWVLAAVQLNNIQNAAFCNLHCPSDTSSLRSQLVADNQQRTKPVRYFPWFGI